MPDDTMVEAVFLKPGCSVVNSRLSASVSRPLPSSRSIKRPGPQVGSIESEHTIFPPVVDRAANAALSVGRRAGSGFLTLENKVGNWVSREEMTSFDS